LKARKTGVQLGIEIVLLENQDEVANPTCVHFRSGR